MKRRDFAISTCTGLAGLPMEPFSRKPASPICSRWLRKKSFQVFNRGLSSFSDGAKKGVRFSVCRDGGQQHFLTSFCGVPVPKLCIAEPGQTGPGLNRSYALLVIQNALLISQNALPGGEKSKPRLIYFIPFILLLALWAVLFLVFRKRKRKNKQGGRS